MKQPLSYINKVILIVFSSLVLVILHNVPQSMEVTPETESTYATSPPNSRIFIHYKMNKCGSTMMAMLLNLLQPHNPFDFYLINMPATDPAPPFLHNPTRLV